MGKKYPVEGALTFKTAVITDLGNRRISTKQGSLSVPYAKLIDVFPEADVQFGRKQPGKLIFPYRNVFCQLVQAQWFPVMT